MKPILHFVKLSAILAFFGITSCANRSPLPAAHPSPEKELRERIRATPVPAILFVGNSYSFGVPKAFTKQAAAIGKNVRVGHSTYGGWTLARHADHEPTLRKIRMGKWDVVVFQEQSQIPALSRNKRASMMFPPLRRLVSEARNAKAIPVLYQTWGRRYGDEKTKDDHFDAMTERLREGYRAAARDAGGLVVVRVGDAWQKEFHAGRANELFDQDGSHPSSYGNNLTASVFIETLFSNDDSSP